MNGIGNEKNLCSELIILLMLLMLICLLFPFDSTLFHYFMPYFFVSGAIANKTNANEMENKFHSQPPVSLMSAFERSHIALYLVALAKLEKIMIEHQTAACTLHSTNGGQLELCQLFDIFILCIVIFIVMFFLFVCWPLYVCLLSMMHSDVVAWDTMLIYTDLMIVKNQSEYCGTMLRMHGCVAASATRAKMPNDAEI